MSHLSKLFSGAGVLALLAGLAGAAGAQSEPEATPAAGPVDPTRADQDEIEVLTVTGKRNTSAILPTKTDAFGLGMSPLETPRSVSSVSLGMINQYSLQTVRDLIAVTPGVFTASFFGVDGTVNVRGELADNYFRGFKRAENQGNYVTPIQSALTLDVVRGVASPAYSAGRAGGYVNFTPRADRAVRFMDGQEAFGEVTAAAGMYDYYRGSLEYGAPLTIGGKKAGIDIYIDRAQFAEYFRGIDPEHVLAQIGFAMELADDWQVNAGVQYYDADGMQGTTGVNRLTQDLIDNGNYIAGSPILQIVPPGQPYILPANITAMGGVTKSAFSPAATRENNYSRLNPATIRTVKLDRRSVLASSEYDVGLSETTTLYFDLIHQMGGGELKAQIFYDELNVDSYNAYGFAKSLRGSVTEARLSYAAAYELGEGFAIDFVAGAGYRTYDSDEKYNFARGWQVMDRTDLTVGYVPDSIFNPIFLTNGTWDQNYISNIENYNVFFNANVTLFENLFILGGIRWDSYDVDAINVGALDFSAPLNTKFDNSDDAVSWSISASYRTPWNIVPYITYGESRALEMTQGGGLTPANVRTSRFLSPSKLTEGGVKGSFFDDRLFIALSAYEQKRVQAELVTGNFLGAVTKGYEAELRWAINAQWGVSATATWQKTHISGAAFVVVSPTYYGISNVNGWGFYYSNNTAAEFTDNTQPRYVLGLFVNYESGKGFGATLGANWVDKTSGQLPGAVVFPDYFLARGSLHYDWGDYRVALNVNNIFDKRYYVPHRSSNTDAAAIPGEGRTAYITFTSRF